MVLSRLVPGVALYVLFAACIQLVGRPVEAIVVSECSGDCDGSGTVDVDDLVLSVLIALEKAPLGMCEGADRNADADLTIDELTTSVRHALEGCPQRPLSPFCGDGIVDRNEDCDDGRNVNGDGCDTACRIEGSGAVDQSWRGPQGACGTSHGTLNIFYGGPVGQEFAPARSLLSGVAVGLAGSRNLEVPLSTTLDLILREAAIDGPIVATASMPIVRPQNDEFFVVFELVPPIEVTRGHIYVIELSEVDDDSLVWQRADGDEPCDPRQYDPGRPIVQGVPLPTSNPFGQDFLFETFAAVPEGCGDEVVDEHEECDDGNDVQGDGCDADCRFEEVD